MVFLVENIKAQLMFHDITELHLSLCIYDAGTSDFIV